MWEFTSDWLDYFGEVCSLPFSPHPVTSLILYLREVQLWVCPQSPWNNSGVGKTLFLYLWPYPAIKLHQLPANCSVVFNNAMVHKLLHKLIQIVVPLKGYFLRPVLDICSDPRTPSRCLISWFHCKGANLQLCLHKIHISPNFLSQFHCSWECPKAWTFPCSISN